MAHDPYYSSHERPKLREIVMNIVNYYLTNNRIRKALRQIEHLEGDHGYLKSNGVDMNIINHYLTDNLDLAFRRDAEYHNNGIVRGSIGTKNYNINKLRLFKDIPDGIEILVDYVDVTAIRTINIPTEIIYESIYRKLPELFEE